MIATIQRYALLSLIVTTLVLGFGLWRSVSANGVLKDRADRAEKALKTAVAERKADETALHTLRKSKASETRKLAQAQEALQKALQEAQDWSEGQVPPGVRDALTAPAGGLPAVSEVRL